MAEKDSTPMPKFFRTSITVGRELLFEFDVLSMRAGYADRSEAIREAMRMAIQDWKRRYK